MVNAIAPNAPIGAARMMMPTMPNSVRPARSIRLSSGRPRSPRKESAKANRTAKNRTWITSPSAKAPTALVGTMCSRKSTGLWDLAALA
jgi:hypothetical protein